MSNVATPPSSIKTTAIALLFKDGFSIEVLAEIFTPLRAFDIEEHVRRAMFNGNGHKPPVLESPGKPPTTEKAQRAKLGPHAPAPSKSVAKPEVQSIPPETKKRRYRACSHVNPERDKHGTCKLCKKEYMQAYWAKRKKPKPETPPVVRSPKKRTLKQNEVNRPAQPAELLIDDVDDIDELDEEETPAAELKPTATEFVYSKPFTCSKCGDRGVRLRRRADADLSKDYWLHIKPNGSAPCMLKIINYTIKEDLKYQPAS